LEDTVSPVFGRCPKYTIIDWGGSAIKEVKVVDNPSFVAQGGAGIQAANYMLNEKIDAVISSNFGPNASKILIQAGVKMYQYNGSVREAVEKCATGKLNPLEASTVRGHFGMGGMGHRHGLVR
jgi:predicted Fe-Mo cluster-binding NifX family protein